MLQRVVNFNIARTCLYSFEEYIIKIQIVSIRNIITDTSSDNTFTLQLTARNTHYTSFPTSFMFTFIFEMASLRKVYWCYKDFDWSVFKTMIMRFRRRI